ncbi:EAP30/Vps36 family-domain-containing protein [Apodospora peruviana]|uniref:Vacuolar protein-sorting-associated protein 36 n=1 Tax=Apodospora peruviana TaxID=516989 RepID=A0AAE0I674_9PEZI|nr:EAP30/Vps36 family-domain-containing protein [Apodospora peruviana]KAK3319064.1 EAP30/Vps36 family-domain-containing protein [Apodospora peruviana]
MFLKNIDLTTALRPSYLPDEDLLFVQDNVGLYEGKYKLPNHQNGQVYLTSHRICYVDKAEPRRHSVAIDLKDVERYEFYAGFLKSSAKITLIPKASKRSSLQSRSPGLGSIPSRSGNGTPITSSQRTDSPYRAPSVEQPSASTATWVCTICSFSNPVPSNFDPSTATAHTPLPPCLACGIKPTLAHVLKATISNATSRQPGGGGSGQPALYTPLPIRPRPLSELSAAQVNTTPPPQAVSDNSTPRPSSDPDASFECPRCTFLNHPSLLSCEICGAPLISHDLPSQLTQSSSSQSGRRTEADSPGPFLNPSLSSISSQGVDSNTAAENVKLSFRGGGDKIFYERLKGSMTQRKWLLHGAPPIPKSSPRSDDSLPTATGTMGNDPSLPAGGGDRTNRRAGIAGLEHRNKTMRRNNELVIGSAFEDLEALMASAKEIVALAENFARQVKTGSGPGGNENAALLAESASQLGLIATKDIVGNSSSGGGDSLYLSELARTLAEFLSDDARGVLKRAGGIMSLVDLWAVFNRARGGVELVSPADFEKAANLWEKLGLPVRLRTFKSGVKVVQGSDRTDEHTVKALLGWLRDLHEIPPDLEGTERAVTWDWRMFGRGVTARDAAERFGWSIGVAEEELEMAEEKGVLCREESIEGLTFWENFIDTGEGKRYKKETESERITRALKESGFL